MPTLLETARLRLREVTPNDLDFLASLLGDAEVMRFYPNRLDREGARLWLEKQMGRYVRDGHGFWMVEKVDTGEPVGQVGLLRQELNDGVHHEIGYLVHVHHQRQGYATEAARAVRDHAFEHMGRELVVSFIRPENVPSQKVAWKLGMEPNRMITWAGLDHLVWQVERGA